MLTFEQVEPVLHKWANRFQNRDFEYWELINAVWEKGNVQKLEHIEYASARVKFDMLDYLRGISSSRTKTRRGAAGKFYPNIISLTVNNDGGETLCLQDILKAKQDYCKVDARDLFDTLLKGLTRAEKLIIRLRYECDFTLKEIAKVVGVHASRISQEHSRLLKVLQRKLIDMGVAKRKCLRTSLFNDREKEARNLYHREYWRKNKAHMKRQRAKRSKRAKVA